MIFNIPLIINTKNITNLIQILNTKYLPVCKEDNRIMEICDIPPLLRKNAINVSITDNTKKEHIDFFLKIIYNI